MRADASHVWRNSLFQCSLSNFDRRFSRRSVWSHQRFDHHAFRSSTLYHHPGYHECSPRLRKPALGGSTFSNIVGNEALGNTGFDVLGKNFLGIPVGVIILILIALVAAILLKYTPLDGTYWRSEAMKRLLSSPESRLRKT